ncbi:LLM class flavin-dependent oxidoreductase [Kineosporia sp. NBRC 101731]|uniref:LLM class flavin-dependent oxidoreductase n=1 Tax=Kineosporia sp. NBRC 101731 TaxID=3032199 RepID=UPI0025521956|nr:LLM class flavin-dependent oxidoreductase [Kineosporia sp. NBRC 101731]
MNTLAVGVVLPSLTTQRDQGLNLYSAARHAESVGLASVWHGDHLAIGSPVLDITVGLATAAAATQTIAIGAGVFIPALRPLARAAQQIASLQLVSDGRLILGVGSGGGPAQWAAAGIPYAERGPRTDRAVDLLPGLLAGEHMWLDGHRIALSPAVPKPPIWIGNASDVALRRAARAGDGWFPSLVTPAAVAAGVTRLRELADGPRVVAIGATGAIGKGVRSQQEIERSINATYGFSAAGVPISGSPAEVATRLAEFHQAGAHHLVLGFSDGDWRQQCDLLAASHALLT